MPALTLEEAAEELRISYSMVRKLIATQGLPCIRLGTRIIIPREALATWLQKHTSVQEIPKSKKGGDGNGNNDSERKA